MPYLRASSRHGLLEAASLHVAHEAYGVRRLAAAEAFPDIERRADPERGVTLVVERAERHEVLAGAPQGEVPGRHLVDAGGLPYPP